MVNLFCEFIDNAQNVIATSRKAVVDIAHCHVLGYFEWQPSLSLLLVENDRNVLKSHDVSVQHFVGLFYVPSALLKLSVVNSNYR